MIVLKPIATAQTIDVLVREHDSTAYEIVLTDEQTRTSTSEKLGGTYDNGRLSIDATFDLIDKSFYSFKINGSTDNGDYDLRDYSPEDYNTPSGFTNEIFRGKIWVTDQTDFEKFNAVPNYAERTSTNTFNVRR